MSPLPRFVVVRALVLEGYRDEVAALAPVDVDAAVIRRQVGVGLEFDVLAEIDELDGLLVEVGFGDSEKDGGGLSGSQGVYPVFRLQRHSTTEAEACQLVF